MKRLISILLLIFIFSLLQAQDVHITEGPENYQLYPRNAHNVAEVLFSGDVVNDGYESLTLETYRDGQLIHTIKEEIKPNKRGRYPFSLKQEIEAGLQQYKFRLLLANEKESQVCFTADSVVCGDAYIITGQSNSHPSSSAATYSSPWCRSFGVKTGYNPYTEEHKKYRWGRATGNCPELKGVGGWFTDNPFGVGVWGMHLMKLIVETYEMPVCIINGGSGSSSIEENMALPYQADLKTSFGRLIYRIHEAGLTNGIKAVLWHQGETNSRETYRAYRQKFDTLYTAWKANFPALQKVYMFQLHPGCGGDFQGELRDLQVSIADSYQEVEIMSTCGLPGHDGCHYTHEGYHAMAESIFPLLGRDIYGAQFDAPIDPPKLLRAYISNRNVPEVCLEFDQPIQWNDRQEVSGDTYFLRDYFFMNQTLKQGLVESATVVGNKLFLKLREQGDYRQITYLPGHFYTDSDQCYEGPWIMGDNGIGALSFHKARIEAIGTEYKSMPANLQLFPRDERNKAVVTVSGVISTSGYDKAVCRIYRNEVLRETLEQNLVYNNGKASFSFTPEIVAELAEYDIETGFTAGDNYYKDRSAHNIVCGDVYLINGQSNSHPTRREAIYRNEFCRSFGSNTNYSTYDPADTTWGLAAGDVSTQYHVSAWGIKLMQQVVETYQIPVCIINGGSGGSSIEYNLPVDDKSDLSSTYNRLFYRAQKAGVDQAVKALLWHQGESNSNENGYGKYAGNFDTLYSAWKKDYPSIEKVYVFQIHPGCGGERQSELRETQRQFAEKYTHVAVMSTCGLPGHDGCHYTKEGYSKMAEWIFPLVARDFYDAGAWADAGAANISSAYYSKPGREICLVFDREVLWDNDPYDGHFLKDQFYLDGERLKVESGRAEGDRIYLKLKSKVNANTITYLPGHYYEESGTCYQGPWIFGKNGIGALSFDRIQIRAKKD